MKISKATLIVIGAVLCVSQLPAQYGTGMILGTITDPTSAVIPGVTVTARNQATGAVRTFITANDGDYQLTPLPAGTYTVTAQSKAFKTSTVPDVVVSVGSQTRVDVVMEVGAVSETVQVQASAPLLQTNSAAVGTVVETRTVLELPLNARNFFDLVALTPGSIKAASGSSVMDNRGISVGGTRVNNSTYAQLDGVDFTVENVHNPAIALSLDDMSEFKVEENFMDASYGHGAAAIDIVSKSGSNDIHGVVYDFIRNREFQAGQFFRPRTGAPRFTYNQFGGGMGGAIRKNKLFYYGNYEGRRRRTGIILQGLVPTEAMQAGDFSQLGKTIVDPLAPGKAPFPGNVIPKTRFDPIALKMLQFFPAPNLTGRPGVNFLVTPSDRERRDQFTGRIDYKISEKANLFGRYSFADDGLVNVAYRVGNGLIRPDRTQHVAVGYTYVASPTLISETRLGFTKAFLARESDGDRFSTNYAAQLGFQNLAAGPGDYTEPNLNLTGYNPGFPSNTGGFAGYGTHIVQNNLYYRLAETLTKIRGAHSIRIGGDIDRLMVGYDQGSSQDGILNFAGTFSGDSFGDYLLGLPISATGGLGSLANLGGVAKYSIGTMFQAFVQDDWKLTERLTLNLGLRYELFLPWRGRMANFDLGTGRQLLAGSADYYVPGKGLIQGTGPALLPERPIHTDWNNFAPRLGIAYRLGNKTVIRAGAGVFYSLNVGGNTINRMLSTPPFFVFATPVSSPNDPQIVMSQLFPPASAATTGVTGNVDLNKRYGYMYQYNFNVQHQLKPNVLLEFGYIGNTAQKQEGIVFVNQPMLPADPLHPTPFTARMPYPNLVPGFTQTANYQWSDYNAGYLKVVQRAGRGLTYTVAYTFSKMLESGGYGSAGENMYNRRPERSFADDHVPQNFVASWVYDLPVGKGRSLAIGNSLLDAVFGGWELTGITTFQSGRYYTIGVSGDIANVGTGGQRANASGVAAKKLDPRTNGLLGLDKAAFSTPAVGTFGNSARNVQPGFGINQWDMGLYKNFPIRPLGESARLQIRSEWFNIFNHTQFTNPIATVNVSTFGLVNGTLDPRILQLAVKLYW